MNISVFGLGYVGAVSAAGLAQLGHNVVGVDVVAAKVESLNEGEAPVSEPGLDELISSMRQDGILRATTDPAEAVLATDVAFVCVGTPSTATGSVDLAHVESACRQIGEALRGNDRPYTVVVRSTCPPGAQAKLRKLLEASSNRRIGSNLGYVYHPEFLREGSSLSDFFNPARIVFGVSDPVGTAVCESLYPALDASIIYTDPATAALVKYADNAFHAVKVTFANEVGLISDQLGIDARAVMDILVTDTKLNISPKYLRPGFAFGGSCLPKDLRALQDMARLHAVDLPLLAGTMQSNQMQVDRLISAITQSPAHAVGLIGLTFKEGTDDVRESPLVDVAERLLGKGYDLSIFDRGLSLSSMVGANKAYALSHLPHLDRLLTEDLQGLVDRTELVIVSHGLDREAWSVVSWRADHRIIDLVGVPAIADQPGYEGLYWPGGDRAGDV